jgi:Zn-dependent metalloprotease
LEIEKGETMKRYLISALLIITVSSFPLLRTKAGEEQNSILEQEQKEPLQKLSQEQEEALAKLKNNLTEVQLSKSAVPSWLMGELGPVSEEPKPAAVQTMRRLAPVFRIRTEDDFEPKSELADELGQVHVRLQQRYRGLPVVGGELIVHMQGKRTIGVNGHYVPDLSVEETPGLSADAAIRQALGSIFVSNVRELSSPELVVFVTEQKTARLAWSQFLSYVGVDGEFQIDRVFADARTGELLDRHPQIMTLKDRKIYHGDQACYNGFNPVLPGKFMFGEGGSSPDPALMDAYDATGKVYDFYYRVFNRDSYDGNGSSIISTVHIQLYQPGASNCNPNYAKWIPHYEQLAYGDGDGENFGSLPKSLDVTAHEFTHGVTQYSAGLVYNGESGALNEATSDILGECAEAYFKGFTKWEIEEDVFTPHIPGDALRYMYDPARDGRSADYYPDVFPSYCAANPDSPNCYTHYTSGIANLAFYLLVKGGTHPRGKTSVVVPAIGISNAQKIWYRALTVYMYSATDFSEARDMTMHAAADLFGGSCNSNMVAVDRAWRAVGVTGLQTSQSIWWGQDNCSFNILKNPGFEKLGGVYPYGHPYAWTVTAQQGAIDFYTTDPFGTYFFPSHSGDHLARIVVSQTNNPTLYQEVSIPSSAIKATLSFWLRISTEQPKDGPKDDILSVQLQDISNGKYDKLATFSNYDAGVYNPYYKKVSLDVTAYKGRTVRVFFAGISCLTCPTPLNYADLDNWNKSTTFFIDDTALMVQE